MNRYAKLAAAFALTFVTGIAMAQVPPSPATPAPASSTLLPSPTAVVATGPADATQADDSHHTLDTADLSSFFDGLVPYALKNGDVAGGVISVVKDGKLIFARGYGYADLKTRQAPSPQTTLFRPGSISKLFTWTAVMQQVEQGKLDLDNDVNPYLDFKIPAARRQAGHAAQHHDPHRRLRGHRARAVAEVDRRGEPGAVPQVAHPGTHLRAGHDRGVLQLRLRAGRLHRAARVGRAVRRLHQAPHLRSAGHGAFQFCAAAAGGPRAA